MENDLSEISMQGFVDRVMAGMPTVGGVDRGAPDNPNGRLRGLDVTSAAADEADAIDGFAAALNVSASVIREWEPSPYIQTTARRPASFTQEYDGNFNDNDANIFRSSPSGELYFNTNNNTAHINIAGEEVPFMPSDFSSPTINPPEETIDDIAELVEENMELEALNVKLREALVFAIRMADNPDYVKRMVENSFPDILE